MTTEQEHGHKAVPLSIKAAGPDDGLTEGHFEGYASVFGNVDTAGDIVEPGAFTNTLAEWKTRGATIPVLWGHDLEGVNGDVGEVIDAYEDEHGLFIRGRLDLDTPEGRRAYKRVKGRRTTTLSFAYAIRDFSYKDDGCHLYDLELFEVSIVQVPANPEARVTGVKSKPPAPPPEYYDDLAAGFAEIEARNPRPPAPVRDALRIVREAKAQNRRLTKNEQNDYQRYADWLEGAKEGDALLARLNGLGDPHVIPSTTNTVTDEAKAFRAELGTALATHQSRRYNISREALLGKSAAAGQKSALFPAESDPSDAGVILDITPESAPMLRNLFTLQRVHTGMVRYRRIGAPTTGPAVVAEGEVKPELDFSIDVVDEPVLKIAGRFTMTNESRDDVEGLVDSLQQQAVLALARAENQLILERFAAAPGSLTATGTRATAADTLAEAIGEQEATNGLTPSAIIANPRNVAALRSLKSTGSGEYVLGNPLQSGLSSVWGVPLVSTPAMAADEMWIVHRQAMMIYEREELVIITGFDGDDWSRNKVTTIVEERLLPAVIQPSLLTKVTLTEA